LNEAEEERLGEAGDERDQGLRGPLGRIAAAELEDAALDDQEDDEAGGGAHEGLDAHRPPERAHVVELDELVAQLQDPGEHAPERAGGRGDLAAAGAAARPDFLAPAEVEITASGSLEPTVLHLRATKAVPTWVNNDSVAHTVTFENGRCTVTVQPGARDGCSDPFWEFVGTYRYHVSGIEAAGVMRVDPLRRTITIAPAKDGLHGRLRAESGRRLGSPGVPRVVTIFARKRSGAFAKVGRATTAVTTKGIAWRFRVHPKRTTTYQARAWSQPPGGTVWTRATSRLVTIRVR
jgi:hypothetical protein